MIHFMRSRLSLLALFMFTLLLGVQSQPVQAHGFLIRAIPANGDVLEQSPVRLQVWFTESLEPRFSTLTLTNEKGESISLEQNGVSASNPAQLTARIPQALPNGTYIVTMRVAFTSDGHVQSETLVFWVGKRSGNLIAADTANGVQPLEVIWRMLSLIALNILFGAVVLYSAVLVPGWGNPKYPAGKLPPRVMKRLMLIVVVVVILAGVGTILAVLQQASVLFATDVGTVIQNRLWSVVLGTTQIGSILSLRIGLILLAGLLHYGAWYLSTRQPGFVSVLWSFNVVVTGAALATLSASSHAAGATLWAFGSIIVDYLHLLAVGAWVGGLVTLTLTLPAALAPLEATERRSALSTILRRFSIVGTVSIVLLIITGIYSAAVHIPETSALSSTTYGMTLVAKIIMIVPISFLALYHHLIAAPGRLNDIASRFKLVDRLERLTTSIRLESGLGVSIILMAALLASTPPPKPSSPQQPVELPSQEVKINDWRITLTFDPGTPGANTYEVRILDSEEAITNAQVTVQLVYPSLDKRKQFINLDDAGNGVYLGAGSEIDRAGEWYVLIDIKTSPQATPVRTAFRWDVPAATTFTSIRQPTAYNWLSVVGIVVVCVWLVIPGTIRFVRALNLHTESVLIGLSAAVATAIMLALGAALMSNASRQSDLLNNPVPEVINSVLADQASLVIGSKLYEVNCASCHESSNASNAPDLHSRVNNRRDEELYRSIEGHKSVTLSHNEQWHIINYLRSPEFLGFRR